MYKSKFLQNTEIRIVLPLVAVLLFIYILLFEFVLPINNILPKPSILIESIPALFNEYNFINSFISTISIIYTSLFVSYFMLKIGGNLLIKLALAFPEMKGLFSSSKYFLPILLIFLFVVWFGNSFWGELIFIFTIVMASLKSVLVRETLNMNQEFIDSAKSLGLSFNEIVSEVIWKSVQPKIYSTIVKSHILLWSLAIGYEFVSHAEGIGNIFRLAAKYNDLSLIITLIVFVIIIILLGELLLSKIINKYFYWNT